ncbi:MAG: nitronate monooxygenase [Parasporobacterium sp.]|nr:nitronate monooxygenase [Parasporobacterium sp.]
MNRICEIFGIEKPIIQGAMAWAATAPLVGAVSEAGGLGVLGVGFAPPEFVEMQIRETKKLTDKPFAINVFIEKEEILSRVTEVAIAEKAPVIYADTIIGLDPALTKKYIDIWHENGMKVVVKASILNDAVIADNAGADAVIIKGWEAGGHVTYETTMTLVPLAVETLSCPVIAGGGIIDGRGIVAAMALGAEGFEMGSAFLMTEECDVHPNVKEAIIKSGDMDTVVTGSCTGEPCRQVVNPLSEKLCRIEDENPKAVAADLIREMASSSLRLAMADGDMVNGAVMVGQCASRLNKVKKAADVINDAMKEAKEIIGSLSL